MGAANTLYSTAVGGLKNALWRDSVADAERASTRKTASEWAKDAGNNTPSFAQAVAPGDSFSPIPSAFAAGPAIASVVRAKDAPLDEAYSPVDMLLAALTGGGGLLSRLGQAAMDPVVNVGMEYIPKAVDLVNPRNVLSRMFGR